jgi:DNA-binding transcriptional LysR family regulator
MAFGLKQLRHVVALADHGSFVRAAAALHISQPALSRSIQNLEARFGSELFLRSNSGVVPSDLGRLYIERARDLLRMADELDREAVSHGNLRTGRVAVGGGPYPAEAALARAAAKFVQRYPGVVVQVYSRNWDELARQLRSRELDFFVAETSTLQREPDLEIVLMPSTHPLYFVARAGHPLAGRAPGASVAETLGWPFVAPSRVPPRILDPMLAAHRSVADGLATAHPFPAIECNALAPAKRIVLDSDAITASIPSCVATELESGLLALLTREPWMHLHYGIVRLKGRPHTQVAERFLEFVLDAEREVEREEVRLVARFAPDGSEAQTRRQTEGLADQSATILPASASTASPSARADVERTGDS